jgi:hypothetical protein
MSDADNDLSLLLAEPDNLRLALEIAKVTPRVTLGLQRKFWTTVEDQLRDGIAKVGLPSCWVLKNSPAPPEVPFQRYVTACDGEADNGRGTKLRYGLGFLKRQEQPWPSELLALQQALVTSYGGTTVTQREWWLYCLESDVKPNTGAFFQRIAVDVDGFARQFTGLTLDILRDHLVQRFHGTTLITPAE